MAAVRQNGYALEYVNEQTEEICIAAVRQNGYALEYAKIQNELMCLEAINTNPFIIQYVKVQTPIICLTAVSLHADTIAYIHQEFMYLFDNHTLIQPTEFVTLPSTIDTSEYVDPITLCGLEEGTVYGFIVQNGNWHLAGSLASMNEMITSGYRGSNRNNVFVPIKNQLIDVSTIQWVQF
jgi:hypothetical protein